jgi:FdhD protein
MPEALGRTSPLKVSAAGCAPVSRTVPEETPVALVYDGVTHAVMLASPVDLEDFATGFSLTEGKITRVDDIVDTDIVAHENGIEIRIWLAAHAGLQNAERRRAMLGPTGCGLCGVESLDAALPVTPRVDAPLTLSACDVVNAVASVTAAQTLNAQVKAMHAAGLWKPGTGLAALREDVGRHNALDKLAGACLRNRADVSSGVVVLTSRVSVEMIQKAAVLGAPVIVAVSAPTGLALRTAEAAGITLIAIARGDSFEVFTHPGRVAMDGAARTPSFQENASHEVC